MKNKILFIWLALVLLTGLVIGCGKKEEPKVTLKIRGEELSVKEIEPVELKGKPVSVGEFNEFVIYRDRRYKENHYAPSGWMGDVGDVRYNDNCSDEPQSGRTCIEIEYSGSCSQNACWAGIYWQNPPNNWGLAKGGYDLTGAKKLRFWAKGEKGGEIVAEFKMGGITGEYSDSDSASIGPIELTDQWKEYSIDLADMDLSYISGGFCWVTSTMYNPEGCKFYLDEIRYE
jgi:hypothetical protein